MRALLLSLALLAACGGREDDERLELCRQALVACEAAPCSEVPADCRPVRSAE